MTRKRNDVPQVIEGKAISTETEPTPPAHSEQPLMQPAAPPARPGGPVYVQGPPPARRGDRGFLGWIGLFCGTSMLVMTLVMGCLMIIMMIGVVDFFSDPIDNFLGIFGFESDSEPQEVDSRTVVLGIQKLAVLQTASGDVQITKTVVDTGPAPDAELKVTYIGYVNAGIDLALVTEEDLLINEDGSLTVVLPPAQLTGCYLSKPEVIQRDCTDIPFVQDCGKILQRLNGEAYDRAIDELRETAIEMDLLGLANDEAENRIFQLLSSLGYERVNFQRSLEESTIAQTCYPE